jgi:serine/threonine protein kinase
MSFLSTQERLIKRQVVDPVVCKTLIRSDRKETYCVMDTNLREDEPGFYSILDKNTAVSSIDKNFLENSSEKVFVATDTGKKTAKGKDIVQLSVLIEPEEKIYETTGTISRKYSEPVVLGEGTYGTVYEHPSYIVKQSKKKKDIIDRRYIDIPRDILTEIAIYRLISKNVCVPQMYGFDQENDKWSIQLSKGVDTIKSIAKTPVEKLNVFMWKLLACMEKISEAGIIHRDLNPRNIILVDENIQIIDWGLASVSIMNQKKSINVQTLDCRSPEILRANIFGKKTQYDYKIDIFSIGMIFLYLINPDVQREWFQKQGLLLNQENYAKYLMDLLGCDIFLEEKSQKGNIKRSIMEKYKIDDVSADFAGCMLEPYARNRHSYRMLLKHPYIGEMPGYIPPIKFPRVGPVADIKERWKGLVSRTDVLTYIDGVVNRLQLSWDVFINAVQLLDVLVLKNNQDNPFVTRQNIQEIIGACLCISIKLFGDITRIENRPISEYISQGDEKVEEKIVNAEKQIIFELRGNLLYKNTDQRPVYEWDKYYRTDIYA